MNKKNILIIIVILISNYGCCSGHWFSLADKQTDVVLPEPKKYSNMKYEKGFYLGKENINNIEHYKYVFPFSSKTSFEILIPTNNAISDKFQINKIRGNTKPSGDIAYILFHKDPIYYSYLDSRDPLQFYRNKNFFPDNWKDDEIFSGLPKDYPAFVSLYLVRYGKNSKIIFGTKNQSILSNSNNKLNENTNSSNTSNQEWNWSEQYSVNKNIFYAALIAKYTLMSAGLFLTIPLDIVTSPIQVYFWINEPKFIFPR